MDQKFLLFAELCIVGAASQDSFEDIFQSVVTVCDIDSQQERELDHVHVASVIDTVLRMISGDTPGLHRAVVESLYDMIEAE